MAAGCDEAEDGGGVDGHGRSTPVLNFAGVVGRLRRTAELRHAMAGLGWNLADVPHR